MISGGSIFSQGKISGNVFDTSREPLGFSNIVVESLDGKYKSGTVADDEGYFLFKNINNGDYKITVSMMGFESKTFAVNLNANLKSGDLSLDGIVLEPASNKLSEVVVVGTAHVSEIKPSVMKYKTEALISETGGTAGDILKNMPSVAMGGSPGHNRDIRYRGLGNGYTKVLINGRDAGLSGNNRETVLDQIPASSISHIEIMSVPGAEHQSDGINGVVNIVLKDNQAFGLHGKAETYAGNNNGIGAGAAVSHKSDKFGLFFNYDYLQRSVPKFKDKTKSDMKNGAVTGVEKAFETEAKQFFNRNLRAGFDYHITGKAKLTGEYVYGYQLEDKDKSLVTLKEDASGNFKSKTDEQKTEYKPNNFHQLFTSFEYNMADGAKLSASFGYQTEEQKKREEKTLFSLTKNDKWANFQPQLENKNEVQTGEKMFWNAGISKLKIAGTTLSAGYSAERESRSFSNITDKFSYKDTSWTSSGSGSDNFKIDETLHALYLSDEMKFNSFRIKAGLRYEYVQTKGKAPLTENEEVRTGHYILPSLSATYNIDKTQYITLNFGRRVRRPGFKDLNPFEEQKEPLKISKGNPALKPELAWAYEIGYLKNFRKFNAGVNLFYRDINNVIQKIVTEDQNNVVTEQPQNTGRAYVMGYEIMTTANPFNFWNITASFSQFESKVLSGAYTGDALNDQYNWTAKLITDFKLPLRTTVQFSGNAIGPKISSMKSEGTLWFADLGIETKILSSGTLSFRVTDLFDSISKRKYEITDKSVTDELEYSKGRMFMAGIKWIF